MRKDRLEQLRRLLSERVGTGDVDYMLEWLGLLLEEKKDSLLSTTIDMFPEVKGGANMLRKMVDDLTRGNPSKE